jgi:hypothetical protein
LVGAHDLDPDRGAHDARQLRLHRSAEGLVHQLDGAERLLGELARAHEVERTHAAAAHELVGRDPAPGHGHEQLVDLAL